MDRLRGGVQRTGNLYRFANIWLDVPLIVQLVRRPGRRVVEDIFAWGFGEVRPIENATFFFDYACDCLHWRLDTVQVLVSDFAFERGALSSSELDHKERYKNQ
jgi:hypothetical protein